MDFIRVRYCFPETPKRAVGTSQRCPPNTKCNQRRSPDTKGDAIQPFRWTLRRSHKICLPPDVVTGEVWPYFPCQMQYFGSHWPSLLGFGRCPWSRLRGSVPLPGALSSTWGGLGRSLGQLGRSPLDLHGGLGGSLGRAYQLWGLLGIAEGYLENIEKPYVLHGFWCKWQSKGSSRDNLGRL